MKSTIALLLFLSWFVPASAQVATKHQPADGWYKLVRELHQKKMISKDSLLKMKQGKIDDHFQDTLRKYDWIDLGGYLYVDKHFTVRYNEEPMQYELFRLGTMDTVQNFIYANGTLTHTMFKEVYSMQPVYQFKRVNTLPFIQLNYGGGSVEYLKLIAYHNRILVIDTPMNGKTSDKKMFSRRVYMAVEKSFQWTINEK
ncbi:MAG: hypothetical protein K1X56_06215 [Flavobacteriales bacterium]|nr:hypothetical protein [Flavobacteriales bacterium]